MILLICVDNSMGLSFAGKRQSRDSALCERILALSEGAPIHMTAYSRSLFPDCERIVVSSSPEKSAGVGEYCFVEDGPLPTKGVEKIHLFCWNRIYPATNRFTIETYSMRLIKKMDFVGTSHKKITEKIFEPI